MQVKDQLYTILAKVCIMVERIADRLRKALEDEIVTGHLAPGTRLDEVSLATRFKVSRTPIREALNQLFHLWPDRN